VYISHRLASTRFCDRIVYIENGGITEQGTHDELIVSGGKYAYMFDLQSYYYRENIDLEEAKQNG
jgi:ATP-binding cassette subfamily B protein